MENEKPDLVKNFKELPAKQKVYWVIMGVFMFGALAGFLTDKGVNLYTCEQHRISQCDITHMSREMDCVLTNTSKVSLNPNRLDVWSYDKSGILIKTRLISGSSIQPQSSAHIKFHADRESKDIVICSVDPMHKMVGRNKWIRIN